MNKNTWCSKVWSVIHLQSSIVSTLFPYNTLQELNTSFTPVDAKSPVHYSPSIQSTFESLEKTLADPQSDAEDTTGRTQSTSCPSACFEMEPDTGGRYEFHSSFNLECDKGSMTNLQLAPSQDAKVLPKALHYPKTLTKDEHGRSIQSLPGSLVTSAMTTDDRSLPPESKDLKWHEHYLVGGYLQESRPNGTLVLENGSECEVQFNFPLCNSYSAPNLPEKEPPTANNSTSDKLCMDTDQLSHDYMATSSDKVSSGSDLQAGVCPPSESTHSAECSDPPLHFSTAPEELSTQAEGYLPHTGPWLCHSDSNDSGYGCAATNSSSRCSSCKYTGDTYDSEVFSLTDHGDGLWSPFSSSPSLPTFLPDTDCCFNDS